MSFCAPSTGSGNGPQKQAPITASHRHFSLLKWKRRGLGKLRASRRKLGEDKIEEAGSAKMKDPAGAGPEPTHIPQNPPSTQESATHAAAAQTPREIDPVCPSPETRQVRAGANRSRASVSLVSSCKPTYFTKRKLTHRRLHNQGHNDLIEDKRPRSQAS